VAKNEIKISITGDTQGLATALGQATGHIDGFQARAAAIGGQMRSVGSAMTMGVTLPIVGMGVLFGKELGEAQKVVAQTKSVIESTGGVAGVTAEHVSTLAESLMNLSGVDDEAIASGENLLLTFTNIRNGVGEGNDIFDQATRAALDMSVAMGTDMSTASMQVGKALNDPIQGVSALRRVGVQLTDQQENQIKMFMAVGDTASAQKIILGELATEFEGSAEAAGGTAAGQFNRLKESLMNVGAELIEKLLPAFETLVGWVEKAVDWVSNLSSGWQTVIAIAAAVAAAIGPVVFIIGGLVTAIGAIATPVGLVVLAVAALAAGLVWLYQNNEGFREWVDRIAAAIWDGLQVAFNWVINTGIPALRVAWDWLLEKGREVWAWLVENLGPAFEDIRDLFVAVADAISEKVAEFRAFWAEHGDAIMANWSNTWQTIVDVLSVAWNTIRGVVEAAIQIVRGVIQIVTGVISGDWSKVWEGIRNVFGGVWDAIWAIVSGIVGQVWAVLSGLGRWVSDTFGGYWHSAVKAVATAVGGVIAWVQALPGKVTGAFSGAVNWLKDAGQAIMDGLLSGLKGAWERVSGWVSGIGNKIKGLKGPIDYDMRLLVPEGRAIMAGLGQGLAGGFDAEVRPHLADITGELGLPARWQSAGNGGSSVAGGVTHVHFHGPVARDSEGWVLDVLARANRSGAASISGVR
jgi:phage-related minor tail protein